MRTIPWYGTLDMQRQAADTLDAAFCNAFPTRA
jgi:hypothetical protein